MYLGLHGEDYCNQVLIFQKCKQHDFQKFVWTKWQGVLMAILVAFFLSTKAWNLVSHILMIHRKSALTIGKDSHSKVFSELGWPHYFCDENLFNFAGSACVKYDWSIWKENEFSYFLHKISLFILLPLVSATKFATKITYIVQQQSHEKMSPWLKETSRNGLQCFRVSSTINCSSSLFKDTKHKLQRK